MVVSATEDVGHVLVWCWASVGATLRTWDHIKREWDRTLPPCFLHEPFSADSGWSLPHRLCRVAWMRLIPRRGGCTEARWRNNSKISGPIKSVLVTSHRPICSHQRTLHAGAKIINLTLCRQYRVTSCQKIHPRRHTGVVSTPRRWPSVETRLFRRVGSTEMFATIPGYWLQFTAGCSNDDQIDSRRVDWTLTFYAPTYPRQKYVHGKINCNCREKSKVIKLRPTGFAVQSYRLLFRTLTNMFV